MVCSTHINYTSALDLVNYMLWYYEPELTTTINKPDSPVMICFVCHQQNCGSLTASESSDDWPKCGVPTTPAPHPQTCLMQSANHQAWTQVNPANSGCLIPMRCLIIVPDRLGAWCPQQVPSSCSSFHQPIASQLPSSRSADHTRKLSVARSSWWIFSLNDGHYQWVRKTTYADTEMLNV